MVDTNPYEKYFNRQIKVFFDDGNEVRFKLGTLTAYNESFLFLNTQEKEEAIAISRIVRIEVEEDK